MGGVGGGVSSSSRTFNPVSSAEPYFRPFNVTPSSASQFVLAEASRGSPSPLLVHQSPVLNTEELYRAAGWMTPLPKDPSSMRDDGDGGGGGQSEDDDESTGGRTGPGKRLAMLSAKNDQHDTSQRMAHSLALGSSGGAGGSAAAVAAAAADVAAAEVAADVGARTADRIRDEIAREPVLSLSNLAGFGGEPGAGGDGGSCSDGGGGGSSGGEVGGEAAEEEGAEEPGIPKSIAEIYEVGGAPFFFFFLCTLCL